MHVLLKLAMHINIHIKNNSKQYKITFSSKKSNMKILFKLFREFFYLA